jgi:hypothetical protein
MSAKKSLIHNSVYKISKYAYLIITALMTEVEPGGDMDIIELIVRNERSQS